MDLSPLDTGAAAMAEHRRRYEALKAAGTAKSGTALPPPTTPGAAPIAPDAVLGDDTVPGGWYAALRVRRGEALRLVDVAGTGAAALLAWNAADPSERLNHADTIKIQWTARLGKGRVIFTDMGRPCLSVIEDTTGGMHDALLGGSTAASTLARFGPGLHRNTRDNLVLAAGKLGLTRRDLGPSITFFASVAVAEDGRFRWLDTARRPGDFVDLRAETDLLVALSFAPHPLDPAPLYAPGAVRVIRHRPPAPEAGADLCRTATPEAARGFENLDAHLR